MEISEHISKELIEKKKALMKKRKPKKKKKKGKGKKKWAKIFACMYVGFLEFRILAVYFKIHKLFEIFLLMLIICRKFIVWF